MPPRKKQDDKNVYLCYNLIVWVILILTPDIKGDIYEH